MVIGLERGADLHTAQLMPLPLTASCSSKIQIGFTFLVPAHPGSPGQRAVKRVCVRVCVCVCVVIVTMLRVCTVCCYVFDFCPKFSSLLTRPALPRPLQPKAGSRSACVSLFLTISVRPVMSTSTMFIKFAGLVELWL